MEIRTKANIKKNFTTDEINLFFQIYRGGTLLKFGEVYLDNPQYRSDTIPSILVVSLISKWKNLSINRE